MPNGYPTGQKHRKVLEQKLGRSLLPGHETHHKCENPGCIEPEHLEEIEMREHRRMHLLEKPRGQRTGPTTEEWRHSIAKAISVLTEEQAVVIRSRLAIGEKGCDLAAEYGVAASTISNIKYGRGLYAIKEV